MFTGIDHDDFSCRLDKKIDYTGSKNNQVELV